MRQPPPLLTREARVRREFAHLYDGWDVRRWTPAAKVVDTVFGLNGAPARIEHRERVLPEDRFEFRGGSPRRPGLRARTRRSD